MFPAPIVSESPVNHADAMLSVRNLSFRYPRNEADTLRDLTFEIGRGEIFGFLGPSGAGKSTTQKILYKLLSGYSGEIALAGKPLEQWDRSFYETIGVSFELPNHYVKLTARENLAFFASFYRRPLADVDALLARVGLEHDADKLVADFSKGMKMRLNFVRALLHNPDFIFLDEPTSGLDPINAARIKTLIRELRAAGKTIFITTHNMFDADQLCDRVALLHGGEIRALDTPANLRRRYGQPVVRVTFASAPDREHAFPLDGLGNNREFLDLIRREAPATLHSQEATLEEVFIKVTGKELY